MSHRTNQRLGRSIRLLAVLAAVLLSPGIARAASGTVTGGWQFYQAQGNYCDTPAGQPGDKNGTGNQTCDGWSNYQEAEFNTNLGLALTKLYIVDQNGATIGSGGTDLAGNFSIGWSRSTVPTSVKIKWMFEDGLNVFSVRTSSGGNYNSFSTSFTVCNGCTTNSGTWVTGSPGSPNGLANLYNGAQKTYYNALKYSSDMVANFTNLQIWAYPTDCPTACANGSSNTIHIPAPPDWSWQGPQARIAHEMGHIASYKANARRLTHGGYCYPLQENPSSGPCSTLPNTWSYTSQEWRGVALEEARATFYGDVAFYWHTAADPRTCGSTGTCPTSGRLETTITCSGKVGRTAQQVERYIWDTYDTIQDSWGDTNAVLYADLIHTIALIPNGYGYRQDESPFVNSGNTVDDWEAFSTLEWDGHLLNVYPGTVTDPEYVNNCMFFY